MIGGIEIGETTAYACSALKPVRNGHEKRILIKKKDHGLTIRFQEKNYDLFIPKNRWNALSNTLKDFFIQEFAFLSTVTMPLVAELDTIEYSTPKPLFKEDIRKIISPQIPGIADDYDLDTQSIIDQFNSINYTFSGSGVRSAEADSDDGAVLLLSCGKDSLLSLALAQELQLNVTPIHVNDTTTPHENNVSLATAQKIAKNSNIQIEVLTNNVEKLNDFELWDKPPSCLGYSHMITAFCFLALPFLHNNASMVLLGNQQNMNFSFQTKQGFIGYPSYDQTTDARKKQQRMLQHLNKEYAVVSLIEPLTDIAEIKILHSRYPDLAQFQFSCNCLYGTDEDRWCHSCNKCARLGLFMLAHGFDVKKVGMRRMIQRRFKKYYTLFGKSSDVDRYEKSSQARDQQLLAFYMAYKDGVTGDLIELFKKRFLEEAVAREDELRKIFFKIYDADLPASLRTNLFSVIQEELHDIQ